MPEAMNQQSTNATGCSRTKAEGAFIALAAGDALGWPHEFPTKARERRAPASASTEFRAWTRRGGGRFYPHEEVIRAGEYSDDTQLTLAVARCRTVAGSGWWTVLTQTEIPLWTLYERGGGGATKRSAESWIRGVPPWKRNDGSAVRKYFDAGGNGVAMRVLPHAVFYVPENDPAILARDVILDGLATHGHPRALLGAIAYAHAAWWLLRSKHTVRFGEIVDVLLDSVSSWGSVPSAEHSKKGWMDVANRVQGGVYEELWRQVVEEMRELLERARKGLKAGAIADDEEVLKELGCFGETRGAGTVSAAAALYLCARYAAQPVQGVLRAAFATGGDTDTLAAMTGGLLGCLTGSDWLPREWFKVQDCEYLRRIANRVALGPSGAEERPVGLRLIGQKQLDTILTALVNRDEGELDLDGVRRARVINFYSPKPLSKSSVAETWQLRTSEGQVLYVVRVARKSKEEAAPPAGEIRQAEFSATRTAGCANALAAGVKLSVTDVKAVAGFYEAVLGLTPVRRSARFVSYGSVSLVDARYAQELSAGAVAPTMAPGRNRIEIHTPELEATYQRVERSGACIVQEITQMPWGEQVFHCLDPEGNVVEVVERR